MSEISPPVMLGFRFPIGLNVVSTAPRSVGTPSGRRVILRKKHCGLSAAAYLEGSHKKHYGLSAAAYLEGSWL